MQYTEREYLVNRIISGCTISSFNDEIVLVYEPTPFDKVMSHNIYEKEYNHAQLEGMPTEEEILKEMYNRGMWSKLLQDELDQIPLKIEEMKVELYNAFFQFKHRDNLKKSLDSVRHREVKLLEQREKLRHVTCEGFAVAAKNRYLICSATKRPDGSKFFTQSIDNYSQSLLDLFIQDYFSQKISDDIIRDLSRYEPWRSVWGAAKSEGRIFGIPSALLTPEQKLITIWSKIYDSIAESPDCPPDEVMDDMDCLDGWMVVNSRNRENERKSQHGYKPGDKFNKADEVFIMVENAEDIARVNAMNSPTAILRKQQRMNALSRAGGKLEDQYMPDAQQKMREMIMQQNRSK